MVVWNYILLYLSLYLSFVIGVICQFVFLLLPVTLRNWDDDLLNVLTYVSFQLLAACFLFVGFPSLFGLYRVNNGLALGIMGIVFMLGWLRAFRIIPLEFTYPIVRAPAQMIKLSFQEFNDIVRLRQIADFVRVEKEAGRRVGNLKERLLRKRAERQED